MKLLRYQNNALVAYGNEEDIIILERIIRDLINDKRILRARTEFRRLNSELEKNHRRLDDLKKEISLIHGLVSKGVPLDGHPACDKCKEKPKPPDTASTGTKST